MSIGVVLVSKQEGRQQDTKNDSCLKDLLGWKPAERVNKRDTDFDYEEL